MGVKTLTSERFKHFVLAIHWKADRQWRIQRKCGNGRPFASSLNYPRAMETTHRRQKHAGKANYMAMKNKKINVVYSTEFGKMCPVCNNPAGKCICKKQPSQPKSDGIVRIMRETKGRKGKGVTLITGVPLGAEELKKLSKSLKQKCGSGGSVKNGVIEIQGDHRDALEIELVSLGYKVKRAGG